MKVLFVIDVILAGGAEMCVLRLAQSLHDAGHQVQIFALWPDLVDETFKTRIAPSVNVRSPPSVPTLMLRKFDGFIARFFKNNANLARAWQCYVLKSVIAAFRPDVVHSHLLTSDLVAARALVGSTIPMVTTMHGDYLRYEQQRFSHAARIGNIALAIKMVFSFVAHVVVITEDQILYISGKSKSLSKKIPMSKIYNGCLAPYVPSGKARKSMGISSDAFVVGMVGRGIKEKGWLELYKAFSSLGFSDAHLVIVGDGVVIKDIRNINRSERVHFVGSVNNPEYYISSFDVACLASYNENLPTVIAEYLIAGKAIVATEVGEVARMLGFDETGEAPKAGLLVPATAGDELVAALADALASLYKNRDLVTMFAERTSRVAEKFNMQNCVHRHVALYEELKKKYNSEV